MNFVQVADGVLLLRRGVQVHQEAHGVPLLHGAARLLPSLSYLLTREWTSGFLTPQGVPKCRDYSSKRPLECGRHGEPVLLWKGILILLMSQSRCHHLATTACQRPGKAFQGPDSRSPRCGRHGERVRARDDARVGGPEAHAHLSAEGSASRCF